MVVVKPIVKQPSAEPRPSKELYVAFSGHETFVFRYGWLKKAVDAVTEKTDAFSSDDAMVDLGGGSCELTISGAGHIRSTISLPLGAVRLTNEFLQHDPPRKPEIRQMRGFIARENPAALAAIAARFAAARRRGLWHPRRNCVDAELAALTGEAAP